MSEYDIALSFAGEDRAYVEQVAAALIAQDVRVFYDAYEPDLWGKNLYQHLSEIYRSRATYCVVFISRSYVERRWPRHELASAQARALEQNREYILPARFDDTEVPGILPTTGYIDLRRLEPTQVANAIIEKLRAGPSLPVPVLPFEVSHEPVQQLADSSPDESESYRSVIRRLVERPVIDISSPEQDARVRDYRLSVKGTVLPASAKVCVLVRVRGDYEWWAQSPATVLKSGSWTVQALCGLPMSWPGRWYEILAVADPKQPVNPADRVIGWPEADAYSQTIRVQRLQ